MVGAGGSRRSPLPRLGCSAAVLDGGGGSGDGGDSDSCRCCGPSTVPPFRRSFSSCITHTRRRWRWRRSEILLLLLLVVSLRPAHVQHVVVRERFAARRAHYPPCGSHARPALQSRRGWNPVRGRAVRTGFKFTENRRVTPRQRFRQLCR